MIDPALVRDHMDVVRSGLESRGPKWSADLDRLVELEAHRRRLLPEVEELKRQQNAAGEEVVRAKREGLDPSAIFATNKARGQQIKKIEVELEAVEAQRSYASNWRCWSQSRRPFPHQRRRLSQRRLRPAGRPAS